MQKNLVRVLFLSCVYIVLFSLAPLLKFVEENVDSCEEGQLNLTDFHKKQLKEVILKGFFSLFHTFLTFLDWRKYFVGANLHAIDVEGDSKASHYRFHGISFALSMVTISSRQKRTSNFFLKFQKKNSFLQKLARVLRYELSPRTGEGVFVEMPNKSTLLVKKKKMAVFFFLKKKT